MKIEGKNPIRELMASGKSLDKLYVLDKTSDAEIREWVVAAKQKKARVEWVDRKTLDSISVTGHHQGIIAECTDFEYSDVSVCFKGDKDKLIILLDGLQDPHNLGSVLRVAECAGVDAVVIPNRNSVVVNETVIRVSAGASAYVPVCKISNLNAFIKELKDNNYWIFGADMDGQSMYSANLKGNTAIVIGGEGSGLSKLTKELCDQIISIPMTGKVNSLNASVSTGILVYEALRQRGNNDR